MGKVSSIHAQSGADSVQMVAPGSSKPVSSRAPLRTITRWGRDSAPLNTGVPHAVIFVPEADQAPVQKLGAEVRYHPAFAPKGTNVNFVKVTGPSAITVRTYERGVEDETLACGTGSVASAIRMARLGRVTPPVAVRVRSGSTLRIHFTLAGERASGVVLEGEAVVLFEGELILSAFGY